MAPAARSLGGGDWRESDRLAARLIGLLVASAGGTLLLICLLWFDAKARAAVRFELALWWSRACWWLLAWSFAKHIREAWQDWREREEARLIVADRERRARRESRAVVAR